MFQSCKLDPPEGCGLGFLLGRFDDCDLETSRDGVVVVPVPVRELVQECLCSGRLVL